MARPDFICLGFQKCATTTLFGILSQHEGIALTRGVKEPMYYRVPVFHHLLRRRFYDWRYFGHIGAGDPRVLGEVNAGLTFNGCAAALGRDFDHDTKLIFMMRNPVDRAYSAYRYFLARGLLPAKCIAYEKTHSHAESFDFFSHYVLESPRRRAQVMRRRMRHLVLSQSNYATCIQEYLDAGFALQNMHFVFFEEFVRDQQAGSEQIFDFLNVAAAPEIDYDLKINEGKAAPRSAFASTVFMLVKGGRYGLRDLCCLKEWFPAAARAYERFYQKVRRWALLADQDDSQVLPETRALLMDYFAGEIAQLERITGRNLRALWG